VTEVCVRVCAWMGVGVDGYGRGLGGCGRGVGGGWGSYPPAVEGSVGSSSHREVTAAGHLRCFHAELEERRQRPWHVKVFRVRQIVTGRFRHAVLAVQYSECSIVSTV
jgi:hypothetical protein